MLRLVPEHPHANGRTYIVSDPRAYFSQEFYEAIRSALGKSPASTFTVAAFLLRGIGQLNGRMGEVIDQLIGSECYSPARIELDLGWQARVDLAVGLREMVAKTDEFK